MPVHVILVCMSPDIVEEVMLGNVVAKKSDWVPPGMPVSGGGFCDCVMLGSPDWLCSHIPERGAVVRVYVMGGYVVVEMNLRVWPSADVSGTVGWGGGTIILLYVFGH